MKNVMLFLLIIAVVSATAHGAAVRKEETKFILEEIITSVNNVEKHLKAKVRWEFSDYCLSVAFIKSIFCSTNFMNKRQNIIVQNIIIVCRILF